LKNKIEKLSSEPYKEKNTKMLKERLFSNNYPRSIVNRIFHNHTDQIDKSKDSSTTSNNNFIKVPFHSKLAPLVKNLLDAPDKKVAFYNVKTSKKFFGNVKDRTPMLDQSNVVYEVSCQCNKKYIGQ
ncbi:hypothetical protein, partial [Micromonospora noduli]|uniref:hypothetical protein n=1 Tax=Micromonospora noduli TaxID=709876 RepID=UPI001B8715C3